MMQGTSIIGSGRGSGHQAPFYGVNPSTSEPLPTEYISASAEDIERAVHLADAAFSSYSSLANGQRARFLRGIADALQTSSAALVERAHLETALPNARLEGEVLRTSGQLRLFADLVEEGSWVNARIDTALSDRKPLPRPDIRSMLRPLGPVVVFGASNFPLAFSVAGGDTASAFAAGNPVIVKAHPSHPGTSELVGAIIQKCIKDAGLHEGVFSLLFDSGIEVGTQLVKHPLVKAVGFTGSLRAGRALMDMAANRPEPIPCYAEMSSTNPIFVLPGALKQQEQVAADLTASYTLGAGQFCTKPGLVFLPKTGAVALAAALQETVADLPAFTMLTAGIAEQYKDSLARRKKTSDIRAHTSSAEPSTSAGTAAALLETDAEQLLRDPELAEEIFGPATLLIRFSDKKQLLEVAHSLRGHLTATLLGTEADFLDYQDLIFILERKVGRLIFNGYPTGVEVCHAMVHGGPYPATSDGRSTSVGTQAIFRFARLICYQNLPQSALHDALKDDNPLGVLRMVNGTMTRDAVHR